MMLLNSVVVQLEVLGIVVLAGWLWSFPPPSQNVDVDETPSAARVMADHSVAADPNDVILLDRTCAHATQVVQRSWGTLSTGPGNYQLDYSCGVRIAVPATEWAQGESAIHMRFLEFNVNGAASDCLARDYVQIKGLPSKTVYGTYCGKYEGDALPQLWLSDRSVQVTFRSDTSARRNGFLLEWSVDPVGTMRGTVERLKGTLNAMARNAIMQQVQAEQRVRQEGGSGISQVASSRGGSDAYDVPSFAESAPAGIHDLAHTAHDVGIGQLTAVLNGVEFTTADRHYSLRRPIRSTRALWATEPIQYPRVPPQVLAKATVQEQVLEMRQWFRAWQEQDESRRPYKKYFKPVLSYLEGAWVSVDNQELSQQWTDSYQTLRIALQSGRVSDGMSFVPLALRDMGGANRDEPQMAQFRSRMMTMPLGDDLPLARFRAKRDLQSQINSSDRAARFQLNADLDDATTFREGGFKYEYLDTLMEQVPGLDNKGVLREETSKVLHYRDGSELNAAYYSRYYQTEDDDAMGVSQGRRGFNDPAIWMAKNTQSDVHPLSIEHNGNTYTERWSYAIPLEIIYLTPLHEWNPYDIQNHDDGSEHVVDSVRAGCNGVRPSGSVAADISDKQSAAYSQARCSAYDGVHSQLFFRTPAELFDETNATLPAVGVLDGQGEPRRVVGSGVFLQLPDIAEVGRARLRYPIFATHEEASTQWKEIKALQDMLAQSVDGNFAELSGAGASTTLELTFFRDHAHTLEVNYADMQQLIAGAVLQVTSDNGGGHVHTVKLTYNANKKKILLATGFGKEHGQGHIAGMCEAPLGGPLHVRCDHHDLAVLA